MNNTIRALAGAIAATALVGCGYQHTDHDEDPRPYPGPCKRIMDGQCWEYRYDEEARQVETYSLGEGCHYPEETPLSTSIHDDCGNIISYFDSTNYMTITYTYGTDCLILASRSDREGGVELYCSTLIYDEGERISRENFDQNCDGSIEQIGHYEYDYNGCLEKLSYETDGNIEEETIYENDDECRVGSERTWSHILSEFRWCRNYDYDSNGNLISMEESSECNESFNSTEFTYECR